LHARLPLFTGRLSIARPFARLPLLDACLFFHRSYVANPFIRFPLCAACLFFSRLLAPNLHARLPSFDTVCPWAVCFVPNPFAYAPLVETVCFWPLLPLFPIRLPVSLWLLPSVRWTLVRSQSPFARLPLFDIFLFIARLLISNPCARFSLVDIVCLSPVSLG
jgi:hypothetical protein